MDSREYYDFIRKFEARRTSDECYTPPEIYDVVADYVAERWKLDKDNFVRPFYPGGDYQAEAYKPTDIVVDNPPFSIITKICKWYADRGVKFFMFSPGLTLFGSANRAGCRAICVGASITYDNGAVVNTSFLTNLENGGVESAPDLYRLLKRTNDERQKKLKGRKPKYSYPPEVLSATMLNYMSVHGERFEANMDEMAFVRELESQKEKGKGIYGAGFPLSREATARKMAAERAARGTAERETTEVWRLSEREKRIIEGLG